MIRMCLSVYVVRITATAILHARMNGRVGPV